VAPQRSPFSQNKPESTAFASKSQNTVIGIGDFPADGIAESADGIARLRVGIARLGVGIARLRVGIARLGVGIARLRVGIAESRFRCS